MQKFEFYNPTHIVFGPGQIVKLDRLVKKDARVLVLYGGGSAKKTGTLDEVIEALGDRTVFEFGGIEPNPQYDTLIKAVAVVKKENINFLLAIGGGSVIDGTKFIAAAACSEEEPWEILASRGRSIKKAMPFGTVLTLPATGSEMNCGAVVTRADQNAKLGFASRLVFPQFSILDPQKTLTLPERQVVNGIVDAFVHVTEQYVTTPVNAKVQDGFSETLLSVLVKEGPKALATPDDINVRANLMWVATMALNELIGTGIRHDWATHMIGHELTALFDIDHARTLAIVLPGVWEERMQSKSAKLIQLAERVWKINRGNSKYKMKAAIEKTEAFFQELGVKTRLGDYGLGKDDVEAVIKNLEAHGMVKLGEGKDITPEVSRKILLSRL